MQINVSSVLAAIWNGAKKEWAVVEADINAAVKVVEANPATKTFEAQVVADVKQGASDALTLAGTGLATVLPAMGKTLEAGLNAALTTVLGPGEVAASPIVDTGVDLLAGQAVALVQAWALAVKAQLAGSAAPSVAPAQPTVLAAPDPNDRG